MMPLEPTPWNAAELLETEEDMATYPNEAPEDGDPVLIELALDNIAHAKEARHGKS